jgi:YGGT family
MPSPQEESLITMIENTEQTERTERTEQTEQTEQTVAPSEPAASGTAATSATVTRRSITTRPAGTELARRVVVLLFGLIQVAIVLRIVLLVMDAREGNGLVSGILNFSQFFVGPFDGILKTNALTSGGSILDLAAIVALVGWTVLEFIVLWGFGVFRREPV